MEVVWAVLGEGEVVNPACRGRGIKYLRLHLCLLLILLVYMGNDRTALAFLSYCISILRDYAAIYWYQRSCFPKQDIHILVSITRLLNCLRNLSTSYNLGTIMLTLHCLNACAETFFYSFESFDIRINCDKMLIAVLFFAQHFLRGPHGDDIML